MSKNSKIYNAKKDVENYKTKLWTLLSLFQNWWKEYGYYLYNDFNNGRDLWNYEWRRI